MKIRVPTEEGLKYRPDMVVLRFFPTNDVDDISRSGSYGYPNRISAGPYNCRGCYFCPAIRSPEES